MTAAAARTFEFSVKLERAPNAPFYSIAIPASVSRALGKRGPIPIIALVNGRAELRASLVPVGGGRHRLQLPARVRRDAKAEAGDRLAIALRFDDNPVAERTPEDLADALSPEGKERAERKAREQSAGRDDSVRED